MKNPPALQLSGIAFSACSEAAAAQVRAAQHSELDKMYFGDIATPLKLIARIRQGQIVDEMGVREAGWQRHAPP